MLPVLQYRASLFQRRKSLQAPQASQQQLAIQSSYHFILTHSSHSIFSLAFPLLGARRTFRTRGPPQVLTQAARVLQLVRLRLLSGLELFRTLVDLERRQYLV